MASKTQRKKKRLRKKADKLWRERAFEKWGEYCACGKPAVQVHHFYPKGSYNHLRYDLDNAIPICAGCHLRHHSAGDPKIHQRIEERRGDEWVERLKKKSRNRPEGSYKGIGWYEDKIDELSTP